MPYANTLIVVATDCPVEQSEPPVSKRAKKPMHIIQYELVLQHPYKYGHKELIFETYLIKEGLDSLSEMEKEEIWESLFSKGHPCMRASALTKRYGYGAHYNADRKIALYPIESEKYQKLLADDEVKKIPAMKRKR